MLTLMLKLRQPVDSRLWGGEPALQEARSPLCDEGKMYWAAFSASKGGSRAVCGRWARLDQQSAELEQRIVENMNLRFAEQGKKFDAWFSARA
jgi:hypothetical protein